MMKGSFNKKIIISITLLLGIVYSLSPFKVMASDESSSNTNTNWVDVALGVIGNFKPPVVVDDKKSNSNTSTSTTKGNNATGSGDVPYTAPSQSTSNNTFSGSTMNSIQGVNGVDANPTLTLSYSIGEESAIARYVNDVNNFASNYGLELLRFNRNRGSQSGGVQAGEIILNFTVYKHLEQDAKSKIMSYALESIKDSGISTVASNKIYNFIESQDESTASLVRQLSNDVNADFARAYMAFKPFSGVLGFVLGVFAIGIFVTLTLMIVTDLSYIVIPIVRDWLTPASSNAKPKYVSNEAWYAVKEVDSSTNTSKNTLLIYFKKKTMQFVILSICILYLLSGQIYTLIGNIMDMFRGVLE